jgi:hypothetical protein
MRPKLAAIGINVAAEVHSVELDYSSGSLVKFDGMIDGLASEGSDTESVQNTLFIFGCYLGEVLVRNADGEWLATAGTPMEGNTPYPLVVRIKATGAVCNPVGKVFKQFENGPEDRLPEFYAAVEGWRP